MFKGLIDSLPTINTPMFTADKVSDKIKLVVVECITDNGDSPVYLFTKFSYKKTYGKKIRFGFVGKTFIKLDNAVLTLGDCIDCFIYQGNIYILLESRFDSLFDFHKRINDAVSSNINRVNDWDFFDKNDISNDILGKPRKGRQFLKVINSENLLIWMVKSSAERKKIIQEDNKLRGKFLFDENDKMVYSKEALNELFKLLIDDYFKSIITGETGER